MKKILIPTDFSDLGEFACTIATIIAKKTNAQIDVLSIIPGPQGAYYNNAGVLLNDEGEDYSEWYKRLEINKEKMKSWIDGKEFINITSCQIGDIDRSILNYAENNDIDLIVMGTDGLFNKKFWSKGSHTEHITNHSSVPVLSLKCDRSDLSLNEIVFVSDFLHNQKIDLTIIKDLQKAFGSKLVLLKIKTPNHKRSNDQIKDDMLSFVATNDIENYESVIYEDKEVESGIGKFSAERDIDLIVMGTHQGKGFSKLFRKSISDDIVNHLYHPILTFPISN
ncbi:MAG: universal stress protein [Saprospiraceae bacterium]